jgi:hypothetical protein
MWALVQRKNKRWYAGLELQAAFCRAREVDWPREFPVSLCPPTDTRALSRAATYRGDRTFKLPSSTTSEPGGYVKSLGEPRDGMSWESGRIDWVELMCLVLSGACGVPIRSETGSRSTSWSRK